MGARELAKADRTKILAYYRAANKGSKAFNEAEILEELPPALGGDIALFLYGEILKGLPIFRGLGNEVMTSLCRIVQPMTALRGQLVTEENKVGTELYFIVDGEVEVIQDDERLGFLGVGSFFGENPTLEAIEGKGGDFSTVRMRTIRATNQCDLGFIKLENMLAVMEEFPELKIRVEQFRNTGKKLSKKGKNQAKFKNLKAELQKTNGDGKPDGLNTKQGLMSKVAELHSERSRQLATLLSAVSQMQASLDADRDLIVDALTALS